MIEAMFDDVTVAANRLETSEIDLGLFRLSVIVMSFALASVELIYLGLRRRRMIHESSNIISV